MDNLPEVIKQCIYGAIACLVIIGAIIWASLFAPQLFKHLPMAAVLSTGVGIVFLTFIFRDEEPDPGEPLDTVEDCDKVKDDDSK